MIYPFSTFEQELKMHVQNLIMKFGSFHFAQLNTPLNATMLERHLFDMIPGAWKQLGHLEVPALIPKPIPRRKNSRKSIPPLPPVPNVAKDPSNTRRLSILFDVQPEIEPYAGKFEGRISQGEKECNWSEFHSDPETIPSAQIPCAMSKRKGVLKNIEIVSISFNCSKC